MKLYPFILLALIASHAVANEQYSAQHCKALKEEKQRIQERFAKGYGDALRNYLNDRDKQIFQIMRKYCVKPTTENKFAKPNSTTPRPNQPKSSHALTYDPSAINDNWSARNPTYTGEKRLAWDDFYKIPARCRKINQNSDDFITCSEDKLQQRERFEEYWKNRIKLK